MQLTGHDKLQKVFLKEVLALGSHLGMNLGSMPPFSDDGSRRSDMTFLCNIVKSLSTNRKSDTGAQPRGAKLP